MLFESHQEGVDSCVRFVLALQCPLLCAQQELIGGGQLAVELIPCDTVSRAPLADYPCHLPCWAHHKAISSSDSYSLGATSILSLLV